jgi:hypothetical protein
LDTGKFGVAVTSGPRRGQQLAKKAFDGGVVEAKRARLDHTASLFNAKQGGTR